jgi:tRNA pseudouridine32 synthase/23S rRNA pseudouridine746 synthase
MAQSIINLLLFVIVCSLQSGVVILGFQQQRHAPIPPKELAVWMTNNRQQQAATTTPPTIQNPMTKRKIQIGGPTYNEFLTQGGWVHQDGTLKQLTLQALRESQQQQPGQDPQAKAPPATKNEDSNPRDNMITTMKDKWHCITPSIVETQKHGFDQQQAAKPLVDLLLKQDNCQLLFVNKPSGLHCVPSRDLSESSLSMQVLESYPTAKPCHRLDRDTSGIVVFGLTPEAHSTISKQFELRTTSKTYMALIAGHPPDDQGSIDLPIGKIKTKEGFNRWAIGGENPRQAITEWHVLDRFVTANGARYSRIQLQPKTGRGHQLRLHLKTMGWPILGDTLHGGDVAAGSSPRLCLHALTLQVDWKGQRLQATSVAPF